MSAAAAAAATPGATSEDIHLYLSQELNAFKDACSKSFNEHKFDCATAGFTTGNEIVNNFISGRITDTQPGQKPTADNADLFTMATVLAKTNAALSTSLERAQYHEKMSRALTSDVYGVKEM